MDPILKRRLIGASILIALAVIFLPMLLVGPESDELGSPEDFDLPPMPEQAREVRRIPLDPEAARVINAPADEPSSEALVSRDSVDSDNVGEFGGASQESAEAEAEAESQPTREPASNQDDPAVAANDDGDDAAASDNVPSGATTEPEDEIVLRPELVAEQQTENTRETAPIEPAVDAPAASEAPEPDEPPLAPRAPSADSEGAWVVQVASFGSAESADQVQSRLNALGHPLLRDELVRGDTVLHRLRTGPYASEALAATALAQIKATVAGVEPVVREIQPGSATEPSAGFAVQVGSFVSPDNAQTETDRLSALDFEAFRFSETVGEREVWRVMVGPVDTRAAAEALKSRVDDEAGVAGLVVSLP